MTADVPASADASLPTAIVVGGSLAGLTTALSLSRVGVGVTVLERGGRNRQRGGGLLVSDGLVERVTGWGRHPSRPAVPTSLTGGFHAWHEIFSALHAAADLDPNVQVVHDARVLRTGQDDEAAWVETADARVHRADVVIGADGHRSIVRAAVAPDHADATFAGYVVWLTTIDEQRLPVEIRGHHAFDHNTFIFDDDVVLLAGSFPGEDGNAARGHRRIGWAVYDNTHNHFLTRAGSVRNGLVHHSITPDALPADLATHLSSLGDGRWPHPWREVMLASIRAGNVLGTPIAEYVPKTLANGRIAIVGDAAHVATPMTGSGFTEVLDDAEAIAGAIAAERGRHQASLVQALRAYERARLGPARRTVQSGQDFSRRFGAAA